MVVATNIAETSVTLPGIGFVIDCGFTREKVMDLGIGTEILTTMEISQASAKQRAGRAGREHPGKAYRLYTKSTYHTLRKLDIPEIKKANLMTFILILHIIGIKDMKNVDMLTVIYD